MALAALVVVPPLLCKAELTTAMPKAGGVYFYLDRAFGPMAGAVAGLGTWISLTLKTSFVKKLRQDTTKKKLVKKDTPFNRQKKF